MAFVNGQAVFQLESIRLRAAIHERLLERLSEGVRLHKTFDEVRANLDPLPKGELSCYVTGVCQSVGQLQGMQIWDDPQNCGSSYICMPNLHTGAPGCSRVWSKRLLPGRPHAMKLK